MKVNVDYEMVLNTTDKLIRGEVLTKKETKDIITVLVAVQGDYIPTRYELEKQKRNVERLDEIDVDKSPNTLNCVLDECTEFENKYC
ncbi:hypothetical protein [Rhodopseudomonas parapalustris]